MLDQVNNQAKLALAKDMARVAGEIAADLALGTPEALERVLVSAQDAFDAASLELEEVEATQTLLLGYIDDTNSELVFLSASEVDPLSSAGERHAKKVETLGQNLTKFMTKLTGIDQQATNLQSVRDNAYSALINAEEAIANQGKS